MINNSLLPDGKFDLSYKSLGLQPISSEKLINYKLFHIDKLVERRKQSGMKYDLQKDKKWTGCLQNRGLLFAIPKLQLKQKRLIRIKTNLKDSVLYVASPSKSLKTDLSPSRKRQCIFAVSNKRLSTSFDNSEESPQSNSKNKTLLLDQLKQTKTMESGGVGIRVRRKRKTTINQFLQQKNQKIRAYECNKLCRTDIIPNYLIFSEKSSKSQEQKLIKNISQRIYPVYKICPNFDALQR